MFSSATRVALPALVALATVVTSTTSAGDAAAQEIEMTGPLGNAPGRKFVPNYLPWWLRGDAALAFTRTPNGSPRTNISYEGFAGSVRWRRKATFAFDFGFAYLRGVEDASARSIPVTARVMHIHAPGPDWEYFGAAGPSFEHVTTRSMPAGSGGRLGLELSIGVDRRIDPIWNRFLVELSVAERWGQSDGVGRSTMVMLRIGIATTFGFRHYE